MYCGSSSHGRVKSTVMEAGKTSLSVDCWSIQGEEQNEYIHPMHQCCSHKSELSSFQSIQLLAILWDKAPNYLSSTKVRIESDFFKIRRTEGIGNYVHQDGQIRQTSGAPHHTSGQWDSPWRSCQKGNPAIHPLCQRFCAIESHFKEFYSSTHPRNTAIHCCLHCIFSPLVESMMSA